MPTNMSNRVLEVTNRAINNIDSSSRMRRLLKLIRLSRKVSIRRVAPRPVLKFITFMIKIMVKTTKESKKKITMNLTNKKKDMKTMKLNLRWMIKTQKVGKSPIFTAVILIWIPNYKKEDLWLSRLMILGFFWIRSLLWEEDGKLKILRKILVMGFCSKSCLTFCMMRRSTAAWREWLRILTQNFHTRPKFSIGIKSTQEFVSTTSSNNFTSFKDLWSL